MVEIGVGIQSAKITDGVWESDDKDFLRVVKIFADHLIVDYTPWSDYTLAEMAVQALGGVITKTTDKPKFIDSRAY